MADETQPGESQIKGRLLVDCELGNCNSVVLIDAADAATLAEVVDTTPAAVAYAELLAK